MTIMYSEREWENFLSGSTSELPLQRLDDITRSYNEVEGPQQVRKMYWGFEKALTKALQQYPMKTESMNICITFISQITRCEFYQDTMRLFIQLHFSGLVLEVFERILDPNVQELEEETESSMLEMLIDIIQATAEFSKEGTYAVEQFIPYCVDLMTDEKKRFVVRLEASKFLNSWLENRDGSCLFPVEAVRFLQKYDQLLYTAGDLELQLGMTEFLFRIQTKEKREAQAEHWFQSCPEMRKELVAIRENEFERDCRKFINKFNENCEVENRRVYSVPCKEAYFGTYKVPCATCSNGWFWTDFNLGSKSLSFFACASQNDSWETVVIKDQYIVETRLNERKENNQVVLVLTLNQYVSTLLSFCPERNESYVKFIYDENNSPVTAANKVFTKQLVVSRKVDLSPDVIASTPPKASVAINAVHLSSRSKGVAKTVSTVTRKQIKAGRMSSDDSSKKDKAESDKSGKQETQGPSEEPKDHEEVKKVVDSGKIEVVSVNDGEGNRDISDTGENCTRDPVDNEDKMKDVINIDCDIDENVKEIIGETQSLAGSQENHEEHLGSEEITEKTMDNDETVATHADQSLTEHKEDLKDIQESDGHGGTSSSIKETKKQAKSNKKSAPRPKTVAKKGKAKTVFRSTSESERTDETATQRKTKKKETESVKRTIGMRTRSQRKINTGSRNKLGTGYNTEDWTFGLSDVDRRNGKKKALQKLRDKGDEILSQSRISLINKVFRGTPKTTGGKLELIRPFHFESSPIPKRTKQGLQILRPATRIYEMRKRSQLARRRSRKIEKRRMAGEDVSEILNASREKKEELDSFFSDVAQELMEKEEMKKKKQNYSEIVILSGDEGEMNSWKQEKEDSDRELNNTPVEKNKGRKRSGSEPRSNSAVTEDVGHVDLNEQTTKPTDEDKQQSIMDEVANLSDDLDFSLAQYWMDDNQDQFPNNESPFSRTSDKERNYEGITGENEDNQDSREHGGRERVGEIGDEKEEITQAPQTRRKNKSVPRKTEKSESSTGQKGTGKETMVTKRLLHKDKRRRSSQSSQKTKKLDAEESENGDELNEEDDRPNVIEDMRKNFEKILEESRHYQSVGRSPSPGASSPTPQAQHAISQKARTKGSSGSSRKGRTSKDHREDTVDSDADDKESGEESPRGKDRFIIPRDPFKFDVRTPKTSRANENDSGFIDKTPGSSSRKRTSGTRDRTPGTSKASGTPDETPVVHAKMKRRFGWLDISRGTGTPRRGYRSNEETRSVSVRQQVTSESSGGPSNTFSQPSRKKSGYNLSGSRKRKERIDEDIGLVSGPFTAQPERRKKQISNTDEEELDRISNQDVTNVDSNLQTPGTDNEFVSIKPRKLFQSGDWSSQMKKRRISKRQDDEVDEGMEVEEHDDEIGEEMKVTLASLGQNVKKTIKERQNYVNQMANSSLKLILSRSEEVWANASSKRKALLNEYVNCVNKCIQDYQQVYSRYNESQEKILSQLKKLLETMCNQRKEDEKCLHNIAKTVEAFSEAAEDLEEDSQNQQTSLQNRLRKEMLRYRDQIVEETQKQEIANLKRRIQAMLGTSL